MSFAHFVRTITLQEVAYNKISDRLADLKYLLHGANAHINDLHEELEDLLDPRTDLLVSQFAVGVTESKDISPEPMFRHFSFRLKPLGYEMRVTHEHYFNAGCHGRRIMCRKVAHAFAEELIMKMEKIK